jgi:hypothetical protein
VVLTEGVVYPKENALEKPRHRRKTGELAPIVMVVAVLSVPRIVRETRPVERLYIKEARVEPSQPVRLLIALKSLDFISVKSERIE